MSNTQKNKGRSTSGLSATQQDNTQVKLSQTREEKREPKRPSRVPMVAGLKLAVSDIDPNYHYCWVQDRDGNIDGYKAAYYEHVVDANGQNRTRSSGAYPLFLMRLKNEYWEADQRLKDKGALAKLQEQQALKSDEYIPGAEDGRTHVLEKDDYDPLA